jgi:hypothetical protein
MPSRSHPRYETSRDADAACRCAGMIPSQRPLVCGIVDYRRRAGDALDRQVGPFRRSAGDQPSASTSSPSSGSSGSRLTKITTYPGRSLRPGGARSRSRSACRAEELTKVTILQHPSGNSRDAEINNYALPILINESLTAQSANIDMVSGATLTSGAT